MLARAVLITVTSLVMDGQCQDEFLHCTNPGSEKERINVTFGLIRQHATSCPFFEDRSGVMVCQRVRMVSSVLVMEYGGKRLVLGILGAPR